MSDLSSVRAFSHAAKLESAPESLEPDQALLWELEKAQITLASIGDGVIRTNANGLIDYLNPMAERLTGWPAKRAMGQPVTEVFRIVDEVTRQPLPDPLRRCLAEGRVVESPGHAMLLSDGGKEYSVREDRKSVV